MAFLCDAISLLQFANVTKNQLDLVIGNLWLGWHVAELPVVLRHAAPCRHRKTQIGMTAGVRHIGQALSVCSLRQRLTPEFAFVKVRLCLDVPTEPVDCGHRKSYGGRFDQSQGGRINDGHI